MSYSIISVREHPESLDRAVEYLSSKWKVGYEVYRDCVSHSITTDSPLPRWYLLTNDTDKIVGCYGLIANDFNSRQDLWPWLVALYVEESERGQSLGGKMLAHGAAESKKLGFNKMYLATDHIGYYEKYGFSYVGLCYGYGNEPGRLYEIAAMHSYKDNDGGFAIEPITPATRDIATSFISKEWQSARIAIRGEIIDCTNIDGFIILSECGKTVIGLATYIIRGDACEIVSLNSKLPCMGIGAALVEKVKAAAIAQGCKSLRLLTSNDNLNAIGFYQKRGFEIVGLNLGAIDRERETVKPEIPLVGQNGIPLRHEIDFLMRLD